jgi:hypothetical protein
MSIALPLTAGSEIQKAGALQKQKGSESSSSRFGVFSDDVIKISQLGLQKQLSEKLTETSVSTSNESVRVSSTIGKSQSVSNLTQTQATQLYKDIAAIL